MKSLSIFFFNYSIAAFHKPLKNSWWATICSPRSKSNNIDL